MPNTHNPLTSARHIAIEGPIGVGKTSLARRLADHLQAELVVEEALNNAFLARYYRDPRRYALATQLDFLFARVAQWKALAEHPDPARARVCDYLFEKDALFASVTLDDDEQRLYRQVYDGIAAPLLGAAQPDLVIYLQASPQTLAERVRRRGVESEMGKTGIDDDYLARVANAYMSFFHNYAAAPVMVVNSENLNFADSDADFQLLVQRITAMRGHREYFNRGE